MYGISTSTHWTTNVEPVLYQMGDHLGVPGTISVGRCQLLLARTVIFLSLRYIHATGG